MSDDNEYEDDMDGWIEPEEILCEKCERPIELPKNDGPYEYYETKSSLHGLVCANCSRPLCDDCGQWKQSNERLVRICSECYEEEIRSRIDISIHNAITFAAVKHDGQYRKKTKIPYIAHLMEVMQILIENNCEEAVIIAGILHDTLEDTKTTPDEIRTNFGNRILKIVQSETEDKTKSWTDRKLESIGHIRDASIESKLVCCADKLSNMRSIYADLKTEGEGVWNRFNAGKDEIQMYYKNIIAALYDISDAEMYLDLKEIIDDVFTIKW